MTEPVNPEPLIRDLDRLRAERDQYRAACTAIRKLCDEAAWSYPVGGRPTIPIAKVYAALGYHQDDREGAFDIARRTLMRRYGTLDSDQLRRMGADEVEVAAAVNVARRDREGEGR